MNHFQYIYTEIKEKLGRRLNEEEIDFLRWVHEQHLSELSKQEKTPESSDT